ncbi:uncharacterized protein N0V89_004614 [Didymosphaeria variabile]|uniref:RING-type domain-containing protein n=1 Tax=Didymosphaeria variabile TaxID=1932322 RepID=A0A9W8XQL2_9PLEO|nr:uncharacterized protein N0V89_004614 [Didymosphaeria variabile]KAJ4356579.1 hypothetical protein N0V89_004614 [Didymosphaeria variabile]
MSKQTRMHRTFDQVSVTFTLGAEVLHMTLPRKDTFYPHPSTVPIGKNTPLTRQVNCPVCTCPAEDALRLYCGHVYCKECFVDQCTQHSQEFPIRCLEGYGDSRACNQPLSLCDLERALPASTLDKLLEASFKQYIRSRPAKFRYCPVPTCGRLNPIKRMLPPDASPVTITCYGCREPFCLTCNAPAHPNRTCEQAGNNASLDEWKRESGAKDCPKCSTTTIKESGCNHMRCPACMVHFCWSCLASLGTSGQTYEHMNNVHNGDWGIERLPYLPAPPNILVRIAARLGINYEQLLQQWDWELEHQPGADEDDDAEQQPEIHPNGDDAEPQPGINHDNNDARNLVMHTYHHHLVSAFEYAFEHGFGALRPDADRSEDRQEAFIALVRNVAHFIEWYPQFAINAFCIRVDRLRQFEDVVLWHLDDAGPKLRLALDKLYERGLYDMLFYLELMEERERLEALRQHIIDAIAQEDAATAININDAQVVEVGEEEAEQEQDPRRYAFEIERS